MRWYLCLVHCGGRLRAFDLEAARPLRTGDVVETELGTAVVERVVEPHVSEIDEGWVIVRVPGPN